MQELTIFLCNCLKAHVLSINIFPFLRALAHCLPVLEDEDQRLYHKNMKIIFPNYLVYIIDHGVGAHASDHGVHMPCHSARCWTHQSDNCASMRCHRLTNIAVRPHALQREGSLLHHYDQWGFSRFRLRRDVLSSNWLRVSTAQELLIVATEEGNSNIREWCGQKNAENSGAQPGTKCR